MHESGALCRDVEAVASAIEKLMDSQTESMLRLFLESEIGLNTYSIHQGTRKSMQPMAHFPLWHLPWALLVAPQAGQALLLRSKLAIYFYSAVASYTSACLGGMAGTSGRASR